MSSAVLKKHIFIVRNEEHTQGPRKYCVAIKESWGFCYSRWNWSYLQSSRTKTMYNSRSSYIARTLVDIQKLFKLENVLMKYGTDHFSSLPSPLPAQRLIISVVRVSIADCRKAEFHINMIVAWPERVFSKSVILE